MIAEKSVNCSMISLPRIVTDRKLPFCGPLEGLALMYVLREQVSKVTLLSSEVEFKTSFITQCVDEKLNKSVEDKDRTLAG